MKKLWVATLVLALSSFTFFVGVIFATPSTQSDPITIVKTVKPERFNEIYRLVNDYRAENGLQPLIIDEYLCEFTDIRVEELKQEFNHDKFDQKMPEIFTGSEYEFLAENAMRNHKDANDALEGWIESPKHKENMDDSRLTHTCISESGNIAVQIFGGL